MSDDKCDYCGGAGRTLCTVMTKSGKKVDVWETCQECKGSGKK